MSVSDTSAWLPCVLYNKYRYYNIDSNALVWKNTWSTFASIAVPSTKGNTQYHLVNKSGTPVFEAKAEPVTFIGGTTWANCTTTATTISKKSSATVRTDTAYTPMIEFDLYCDDITDLSTSDDSITAKNLIASFPTIIVTAGTTTFTYEMPPNQPFIHVSWFGQPTTYSSAFTSVTIKCAYRGCPSSSPANTFLQVKNVNVTLKP